MHHTLTSPRLYFRQFTIDDAPLILALNTPNVLTFIHERIPNNLVDAQQIIQNIIIPQYELYNLGRFAVFTKEYNRFVGWCGLKFLIEENEIDLGYRYLENECGKGFATEAAKAILDWGFIERKLKTIVGKAHIDNYASQNVLEKIGMQYCKTEQEKDSGFFVKHYSLSS